MSTQRRDNRTTPATKTCRWGPRNRWRRMSCTERAEKLGLAIPALAARYDCVVAKVGTAPPEISEYFHPIDKDMLLGTPDGLATNSLQSDHRIGPPIRPDNHCGSPPLGAGRRRSTGIPATLRSSLPHIPSPPGPADFNPALT